MKKPLLFSLLFALLTMAAFAGGKTYSYTYELQRGWNLIGIFLKPSYDTQAQLEAYQLYEYSRQGTSGAFRRASEITGGKAYWIYWEGDSESLTIEGTMLEGIVKKDVPTDPEGAYDLTETVFAGNEITRTAPEVDGYEFTGWTATGVTLVDATSQTISFTMPANDVSLSPNYKKSGGTYLVVNLDDGSYRYTETAPDLSSDTCRTTELWLRRIPAGTFTMGSPEDELGRYDNETQHQVTLSEDFYIGVFEMTQRQYELITGSRPSDFSNADCYTTRPVEFVSYNDIRGSSTGAGWPSSHDVDSDSFLGKLRAKTGLPFDLPTEAQWEYACRAGTTTALNTGKNLTSTEQDSAMDEAGRYWYNGGSSHSSSCDTTAGTAKVGSYLPNNWELYDMHGNVWEWCLDWYRYDLGSAVATDPVGATAGSGRVYRGGSWDYGAQGCRSARRCCITPSFSGDMFEYIGFRVVMLPSVQEDRYVLTVDGVEESVCYGAVVSKTAPTKEGYIFTGWTVDGVTVEDASANPLSFTMPDHNVTLTPNYLEASTLYLVVNLETGSYHYSGNAPDLSSDTCRTTELWLRRIPAGTFTMGSPEDELGRYNTETQHQVTLSEDFYIGVFEMTQKQYELIYGSNPSYWGGDTRPVEQVSYDTIRGSSSGAGWPSSHDVDSDSFLGKLRSKTKLTFDLPTEAQWEYACRAGTTTALNTGKNLTSISQDSAMDEAGRYGYNNSDGKGGYSQHAKVGSYLPNAYGLYDLHGNVFEWCLDWMQDDLGSTAVTDPVGATSGSVRVLRGGGWGDSARVCRSASSDYDFPSYGGIYYGFRVAFVPSVHKDSYVLTVDGVYESVTSGTVVSKTAANKTGYIFTGWTVEGVTVEDASANPLSFTMPDNDVTLTSNYEKSGGGTGGTYLVVNLSSGSYRYTETAPDLSSDTCRTTELWLRRIPAGTFTMGSPKDEVGRSSIETQHQVTLSEDFYIGVFEMTQKQYELIYGSNPSYWSGDTRPVENVSYNTIRGRSTGAGWPSSHGVDSDSFLGKLRSKTGLVFDLPTEAQWEYACRAGTTTALNTGKNLTDEDEDSAMDEAGRYGHNTSDGKGGYDEHTQVGSYLPNAYGLYDMHGNVFEWCLDWMQDDLGSAAITDPVGATSGSYRVIRGGSWDYNAQSCRSADRYRNYPSFSFDDFGFRVVLLP